MEYLLRETRGEETELLLLVRIVIEQQSPGLMFNIRNQVFAAVFHLFMVALIPIFPLSFTPLNKPNIKRYKKRF